MKVQFTVCKAPSGSPLLDQVYTLSDGDSLGRNTDNKVVLVDEQRVISSRHAQLKQKDSELVLIDQSTNGTFYNGSPDAIGKNNTQVLSNGDLINIGDYQLSLELLVPQPEVAEPAALPDGLEHAGFLDNVEAPAATTAPPAAAQQPPEALNTAAVSPPAATLSTEETDDFDQWLTPTATAEPDEPWGNVSTENLSTTKPLDIDNREVSNDPLETLNQTGPDWSDPDPGGGSSSDGDGQWWQTELDNAPPLQQAMPAIKIARPDQPASVVPKPTPTAPPPPTAAVVAPSPESADLAKLLGLRNLSPSQQAGLAPTSADIIQQTTTHLLGLLQSRASIKNELRTSRTMIQTTENNPLKFSVSTPDALQALFASTSDSFLPPEQAVKESFEDIADHQIAMLFAMKVAFNEMLANFHPAKLEAKFNPSSKGLLSSLKSKQWESYGALYQELQNDPETSYNQLFGEAFAQAYEAKLLDLKASRRFD